MASRQSVTGRPGRDTGSDPQARNTENPLEGVRDVHMDSEVYTLCSRNRVNSPPTDTNLGDGLDAANFEEQPVEVLPSNVDRPNSTETNDVSDMSSETMMKDEAELLLSLTRDYRTARNPVVGCSVQNIRYIYLTQQSIYKILNLEATMKIHGFDLKPVGVELLKGAAVIVGHENGWKLRRIETCNPQTMELFLEDGTIVTEYVVGELNHQIEASKLDHLRLRQIAEIYARLAMCGSTTQRIQRGNDVHKTLQDLAQELVNIPSDSFLETFKTYVDRPSTFERRQAVRLHAEKLRFVGNGLPDIWRSWLGNDHELALAPGDVLGQLTQTISSYGPSRRFHHASAAAVDPRSVSTLHAVRTDEASISIRAPRMPPPCNGIDRSHQPNGRVRLRNVNAINREYMLRSNWRSDLAYDSLTDAQAALTVVKKTYENVGDGNDL